MDGESVEEGLHREVKEETGLTVTACRQLFIDSIELGDPPTERPVVFFVGSAFGEVELSEEHLDYLWVKREDLHVYKLGVFIPIINKIYDMLESKDFNDITKFVPAGHMDVTDLGKPDIAQEGGTVKDKSIIQKFDGPSAMMLNSSNEIPNSGFSNREVRHSGEPTDIDRLLQEIAEHRQHIKIEPPIMKTNYSEAGGVADRESIVIEPEQSASFEAGPIQATSSGATIDTPGDDLVAKEASSGIGSAGESSGTIGTNGVMSVSDAFDSTYGGRKVKNNPLEMVEKQNASDISTGVAASAHYDPTPTVVDVDNQSSDTRYADMRPEQRPMGEGEAHLWLEDDGKEDIITNAPLLPQNTDINEENYLSLSDTIQKSKDEADLKVLTRRALKKAEGGKPLVVGGWGNYNLTDREGHKITPKALKPAVKKFLSMPEYANVNIFHSSIQVGRLIPDFTDEDSKKWTTHVNEEGFFALVEFRTDIEVARKAMAEVIKGNLRGFSLSGNSNPIQRRKVCENGHCWQEIDELEAIYELTLCQVPMNQGSWITDILQLPDEKGCPECFNPRNGQYDSQMNVI